MTANNSSRDPEANPRNKSLNRSVDSIPGGPGLAIANNIQRKLSRLQLDFQDSTLYISVMAQPALFDDAPTVATPKVAPDPEWRHDWITRYEARKMYDGSVVGLAAHFRFADSGRHRLDEKRFRPDFHGQPITWYMYGALFTYDTANEYGAGIGGMWFPDNLLDLAYDQIDAETIKTIRENEAAGKVAREFGDGE